MVVVSPLRRSVRASWLSYTPIKLQRTGMIGYTIRPVHIIQDLIYLHYLQVGPLSLRVVSHLAG